MSLVSIIVPIYNTEKYLKRCLESIIESTYKCMQIILINDGSTDNSEEICHSFESIDSRIRYYYKENGGLSSARNMGLDKAEGDYISFVDSDDYIDNNFINILLHACIKHESLLSMCGRFNISDWNISEQFTLSELSIWSSNESIERFLTWDKIDGSVCDKLFHKSLFENRRFPPNRISEDIPVVTEILFEINKLVHVAKPLYYYYKRNNSITNSKFSKEKLSIISSCTEVRNNIKNRLPHLKVKADYYYYFHLIYLLKLITQTEVKTIEAEIIRKQIRTNFFGIILNPITNFSTKIKIIYYLIISMFKKNLS